MRPSSVRSLAIGILVLLTATAARVAYADVVNWFVRVDGVITQAPPGNPYLVAAGDPVFLVFFFGEPDSLTLFPTGPTSIDTFVPAFHLELPNGEVFQDGIDNGSSGTNPFSTDNFLFFDGGVLNDFFTRLALGPADGIHDVILTPTLFFTPPNPQGACLEGAICGKFDIVGAVPGPVGAVPEPGSLLLLGSSLVGLALTRKFRSTGVSS